uniref:ABC transporter domain-containing protein n=1 Tax=Catharus ustulatus TaxID=91951 RepID=A0A8C3V3Z9_CATUS
YGGFLSVQSSIDAAVIEMETNHSVWKEMKSLTGVQLKTVMRPLYKLDYLWFVICAILSYCPYMHFLSVKVLKEKKRLKILMRAMGLQDIAFWLSWSLLYAVYISITASLLTWLTLSEVLSHNRFLEMYFFYFFYGMASIHFTFLLSSLLKQPNISSFVGFLLHILFGALGFLTLLEILPRGLEWTLNIFSPFAFTAGLAKMIKLEKYGEAFTSEQYPFCNLYLILSFDSVLYFLLAIYFDKVFPGKYGVPHPAAFFLRASYWLGGSTGGVGARAGSSHDPVLGCDTEPLPPAFHGKEAIRLNNIKKIYKKNNQSTEALKGLSLDIYEGQVTALLGHSGSGKTALLNVLSGFSKPSAGSAMIYNYSASEMWNMEGMQQKVGICPQVNLHFEALTVKENLRIFAHIKGIQWKEVDEEVQKVLVMLDLSDSQDVCADALSGGQKRKLSLGIAILGNPQVLLLDEPTAGLDPCSRHHIWSALRERRAGRVTLFATQSMEEADAQADRKAFLSCGRLQSVGSSLYLKRKWGIGYHLRMHINDLCDPERVSSVVRQYIPDAVLEAQKRDELCFRLPLENSDSFPDLFKHLESSVLQGVVHYEVNRTTLEDVFLKLLGLKGVFEGSLWVMISHGDPAGDGDLEEREQHLAGLSKQGSLALSGMMLWRQQVCAVLRIRLLRMKHEGKFLRGVLLLFGAFILPPLMVLMLFHLWHNSSSWEITSSPYFLPTKEKIQNRSTDLLILNDTGSEIEDFIAALKSQNIIPKIALEENITSLPDYNGAIKISLEGKVRFTVMCSPEPINCFPVLVNILSNAFLRLHNSSARFQDTGLKNYIFYGLFTYLLVLAAGLPPLFAMSSVEDYKARSQLRLAGLFPSAYWCGQALVDIPLFWSLMSEFGFKEFSCILLVTDLSLSLSPQLICIFGYGISLMLFVYLMAFKFRTGRSNRYIWSLAFILLKLMTLVTASLNNQNSRVCCYLPYIHGVILVFLLRCLEMRFGDAVPGFDPIFRCVPGIPCEPHLPQSGLGAALPGRTLAAGGKIVICTFKYCIEYREEVTFPINIINSFCMFVPGEVLGLLGPNGAGKSTTLKMISGGVAVTAGEVLLRGGDGALGWCPQQDPLWPHLTVLQHLEAFAAIRGMREEDAAHAIRRALDLLKHFKTPARSLSAGEARKLSFALSILGEPAVMLWDEPSVSVDPKGQRMIQACLRSRESAAVLCTQSLQETAAMCDRVAILVSGRLRYIGSLEDLKSKFGTSYHLELKMAEVGHSDAVHTEILKLFPHAARQERTSSLLTYKIPVADALPLSRSFSKLEAAKRNFKLEEYSLSLSTLHQVFVDLTRDAEEHDLEVASNGAVEQRPLQP